MESSLLYMLLVLTAFSNMCYSSLSDAGTAGDTSGGRPASLQSSGVPSQRKPIRGRRIISSQPTGVKKPPTSSTRKKSSSGSPSSSKGSNAPSSLGLSAGLLPTGLPNLGATCYINSALLAYLTLDSSQRLQRHKEKHVELMHAVFEALRSRKQVTNDLMSRLYSSFPPSCTHGLPQSAFGDANEFLVAMLANLSVLDSKLIEPFETVQKFSLVDGQGVEDGEKRKDMVSSENVLTLHCNGIESLKEGLADYFGTELVQYKLPVPLISDGSTMTVKKDLFWFEKQFRLRSIGNSLIISMARMIDVPMQNRAIKLGHQITFPQMLDMSPYGDNIGRSMFVLQTIVVHIGDSPSRLHFITFKRIGLDWYEFDDSKVKMVDYATVLQRSQGMPKIPSSWVEKLSKSDAQNPSIAAFSSHEPVRTESATILVYVRNDDLSLDQKEHKGGAGNGYKPGGPAAPVGKIPKDDRAILEGGESEKPRSGPQKLRTDKSLKDQDSAKQRVEKVHSEVHADTGSSHQAPDSGEQPNAEPCLTPSEQPQGALPATTSSNVSSQISPSAPSKPARPSSNFTTSPHRSEPSSIPATPVPARVALQGPASPSHTSSSTPPQLAVIRKPLENTRKGMLHFGGKSTEIVFSPKSTIKGILAQARSAFQFPRGQVHFERRVKDGRRVPVTGFSLLAHVKDTVEFEMREGEPDSTPLFEISTGELILKKDPLKEGASPKKRPSRLQAELLEPKPITPPKLRSRFSKSSKINAIVESLLKPQPVDPVVIEPGHTETFPGLAGSSSRASESSSSSADPSRPASPQKIEPISKLLKGQALPPDHVAASSSSPLPVKEFEKFHVRIVNFSGSSTELTVEALSLTGVFSFLSISHRIRYARVHLLSETGIVSEIHNIYHIPSNVTVVVEPMDPFAVKWYTSGLDQSNQHRVFEMVTAKGVMEGLATL